MRPSEYLSLKWSDIDWQHGTASVSRTVQVIASGFYFDDTKRKRSRRIVKLQGFVLEALENLQRRHSRLTEPKLESTHDLIFCSGGGAPLRQRTVKREFRRVLGAAGIRPVRLYDLRHTSATLAVAAGVSVKVISEQLGHACISFTLERTLTCFRAFRMRQLHESNRCWSDRLGNDSGSRHTARRAW